MTIFYHTTHVAMLNTLYTGDNEYFQQSASTVNAYGYKSKLANFSTLSSKSTQ